MTLFTIDLHMHTHFSDGRYSPAELLELAARRGLKTVAITDHDNANGYRRGLAPAAQLGLELIAGVELTTSWPGLDFLPGFGDVDLLGYFLDVESAAFRAVEDSALEDINRRFSECCHRLTQAGWPLAMAELLSGTQKYPSLTSAIQAVQRKGYAADFVTGLKLVAGQWRQVPLSQLGIAQAIAAIHAAGGAAVLAHPAAIECSSGLVRRELLDELVEMGLDGLEIYHHRNDAAARQYFADFCRTQQLVMTGGSDEHGWLPISRLGSQPVPPEDLLALRQRAARYSKQE